ncbi:MAG: phytanoyl-CoA dioxygenase family protein [Armatimonadota bacterium]
MSTLSTFLTNQSTADYARDGYVLVPDLFSSKEIQALLRDVEQGDRVAAATRGNEDASGKKAKLAIWHELGDDVWAAASTNPRVVNNTRILMAEEIAFFHGKVMLKEAGQGGAWEWHQDYGYWYKQGFVFPRMISVFVALDAATKENGCLQVLKGSHLLGRLEHVIVGSQTGADPSKIDELTGLFEKVYVEMEPGTALFFHSNLLHASDLNTSTRHRRSFIMCYNALGNPQLGEKKTSEQRPCPVSAEDAILKAAGRQS